MSKAAKPKPDLEAQRAALEAKLTEARMAPEAADLVRQADAAITAHRANVAAWESQIAEIDAQLGVRENDRRTAAAQAREAQWRSQRQALLAEQDVFLAATADAEAAARAFVDAANRAFASNAQMAIVARDLSTTHKVPMGLNGVELATRFAGRLASVMRTIKGYPYRLGSIEWTGSSLYPHECNWRDEEGKRMAATVTQPLLEKGKAA